MAFDCGEIGSEAGLIDFFVLSIGVMSFQSKTGCANKTEGDNLGESVWP